VLKRVLGAADAGWLVAGNMVGAGIFITPGLVAGNLPGTLWPLAAWVVGGALSLCGAAIYGELGARLPRAGGDYQYLRVAFGPLWGFLTGWAAWIVTFSGAAAVMAIVTMDNVTTAWPLLARLPDGLHRLLPAVVVIALTVANIAGARIAGRTTAWLTILPVGGLAVLCVIGWFTGSATLETSAWRSHAPMPGAESSTRIVVAFAAAMVPILFTYSGWNAAAYVAGEIRRPALNLARGLLLGTFGVCVFYVLFNVLLFAAVPHERLAGSTTAAAQAAQRYLGSGGERVLAVLIALAVLGSANVTLMAGARIYYAMAVDGLAPRALSRTNTAGVPALALGVGGLWTALLSLTGRIEALVNWATLAILLLSALAAASLVVLRRRGTSWDGEDNADPPYRCPGYPWIPALYLLAALGVAGASAVQDWRQALYGCLIVGAGVPVYALVRRQGESP